MKAVTAAAGIGLSWLIVREIGQYPGSDWFHLVDYFARGSLFAFAVMVIFAFIQLSRNELKKG